MGHLWDARMSRDPIGVAHEDYFLKDKGIATLQYPRESLPVPDNGRYKLHNEIEDCIYDYISENVEDKTGISFVMDSINYKSDIGV